jgi:DNA-binding CsgD family transcriptional regulator
VLRLLAEGFASKNIAWKLKISEHRQFPYPSIFTKLNVSSRAELSPSASGKGDSL